MELFFGPTQHLFDVRDADADPGDPTNDLEADGVGVFPGGIVLKLPRSVGEVPLLIDVLTAAPPPSTAAEAAEYDFIAEVSLEMASGRMILSNEDEDRALGENTIALAPGSYVARIAYANTDSATYDSDDGAEHVRVTLWPAKDAGGVRVLKAAPQRTDDAPTRAYGGGMDAAALEKWLSDPDPSHRCLAVVGLLRLGKLDRVASAMKTESSRAVQAVFTSAAWFAGQAAEGVLLERSKDPLDDVRVRAIQSLFHLESAAGRKRAEALAEDDPSELVRDRAADYLDMWP